MMMRKNRGLEWLDREIVPNFNAFDKKTMSPEQVRLANAAVVARVSFRESGITEKEYPRARGIQTQFDKTKCFVDLVRAHPEIRDQKKFVGKLVELTEEYWKHANSIENPSDEILQTIQTVEEKVRVLKNIKEVPPKTGAEHAWWLAVACAKLMEHHLGEAKFKEFDEVYERNADEYRRLLKSHFKS